MKFLKSPGSLALFFLPALLFVIDGCASLSNRLEPPEVSLVALRVQQVQGLEAAFDIDLRVLNRSEYPLSIQGIDCDLSLNERKFARGVASPQKEIPAYSGGIITMTVYSSVLDMVPVIRRIIRGGGQQARQHVWTYAVKGHLRLAGSAPWNKIGFDTHGEIDLAAMAGGDSSSVRP